MQKPEEEQEVGPDYKTSKPTPNSLLPPSRLHLLKGPWSSITGPLPAGEYMSVWGTILISHSDHHLGFVWHEMSGGNSNWKIRPSRPSHKHWESALHLPFSNQPRSTNTPTILCCFSLCWNSWRINSCPIWAHLFIVINFCALWAEKQHQLYSETRWLYFCLS